MRVPVAMAESLPAAASLRVLDYDCCAMATDAFVSSRAIAFLAGSVLLGSIATLPGCGVPCEQPELARVLATVRDRYPNFRAAKETSDHVWLEAHGQVAVRGFGVTLVEMTHAPSAEEVIPPDVPARGPLDQPSLLFFEKTTSEDDGWPLAGVGWHREFDPCRKPVLDDEGALLGPDAWLIHEAGWHHVPLGDGGFTAATAEDVAGLDAGGCVNVDAEQLPAHLPDVAHGRVWTAHAWLTDGGCAEIAKVDPLDRSACDPRACRLPWDDSCSPAVELDPRAFFLQGDCSATCAGKE